MCVYKKPPTRCGRKPCQLQIDMRNFQGNKYTHKRADGLLLPEHVSVDKKFDMF